MTQLIISIATPIVVFIAMFIYAKQQRRIGKVSGRNELFMELQIKLKTDQENLIKKQQKIAESYEKIIDASSDWTQSELRNAEARHTSK